MKTKLYESTTKNLEHFLYILNILQEDKNKYEIVNINTDRFGYYILYKQTL